MVKVSEVDGQLLEEIVEWSPPKHVGRKFTRMAVEVPTDFWDLWRDYKDEVKALGVRVFKDDDEFRVSWVTEDDPGSCIAADLSDDQAIEVRHHLRCPEGAKRYYLRPYQNDAYFTMLQAFKSGVRFILDASDAGMGKTWNALELMRQLGWNFGVVCPANVVTKWTNTAIDDPFHLEPEFVLSYEKLRSGKSDDYLTRTERIYRKKKVVDFRWNTIDKVALIFDEVHMCAAQDSLNSRVLKAAIDDPNILVVGASATSADSPLSMRVTGYGLELHHFDDWWQWCKKTGCRPGPFGGLIFNTGMGGKRAPTPNQRRARRKLQEVHAHIFPRRGTRIRKAEHQDELPENLITADVVDLAWDDPRLKAALAALDVKEETDEEKAMDAERAVSDLTLNTRARQRTELLKLPAFHERVGELRAEGNSVIVFLNYSESIELLSGWLKKEPHVTFVGGLTRREQDERRRAFQDNDVRVFIAQAAAGSASIDLDDTVGDFPRVSIISPGYSAVQLTQALGRPHRGPTTKSKVIQWILFAAGTVEERACRIVQHKLNNQGLINDGDLAGVTQII